MERMPRVCKAVIRRVFSCLTTENPDQVMLKALRDLASASMLSSAKSSRNLPTDEADRLFGAEFPMRTWWISKMTPHQTKKHHDLSSYNWNSFGLRYGK
uniref:Uncharacterized protein n=1 Tax=Myripristis murdjan TaxID=586833 RepID=A0A667YR68_9TELE